VSIVRYVGGPMTCVTHVLPAENVVRYVGGPLDVTGWADESVRSGVYEVVNGWVTRAADSTTPTVPRTVGPGARARRRRTSLTPHAA
jgi:hypothetical protein